MYLIPEGRRRRARWWGADQLSAMHWLDGALYCFSTTPTGDKLFAQPYRGDFGQFEIGAGKRDIRDLGMVGSLRSQHAAVAVQKPGKDWGPEGMLVRQAAPVGDCEAGMHEGDPILAQTGPQVIRQLLGAGHSVAQHQNAPTLPQQELHLVRDHRPGRLRQHRDLHRI